MVNNNNKLSKCTVCGGSELTPLIDLGPQPLCDDLVPIGDSQTAPDFDTEILFCNTCYTGLQAYPLQRERLFPRNYHYRARWTRDVLDGMQGLVAETEKLYGSLKDRLVLDIGCNDGSLLNFFNQKGCETTGIEPTDAALDARENNHKIIQAYFDESSAAEYLKQGRKPDIITFTNVFAHIEDLDSLLNALKLLLKDDTVLVIENHYLVSVLKGLQFDTFYQEHPRTYSCKSFEVIAERLGLNLNYVEYPSRYGGNIRVFMSKRDEVDQSNTENLPELLNYIEQMNASMKTWHAQASKELKNLTSTGFLFAKSFPGRVSIILKLLGLDQNHIAAVYEKPGSMKVGHYVPGTRIPILSDQDMPSSTEKMSMLVLGWHIQDELVKYMREQMGFRGRLYSIMPEVRLID